MLGVGIGLAVIFDALLIRMSLLPAAMCYLGRANWWAPRLRRKAGAAVVRGPGQRVAEDQADT